MLHGEIKLDTNLLEHPLLWLKHLYQQLSPLLDLALHLPLEFWTSPREQSIDQCQNTCLDNFFKITLSNSLLANYRVCKSKHWENICIAWRNYKICEFEQ